MNEVKEILEIPLSKKEFLKLKKYASLARKEVLSFAHWILIDEIDFYIRTKKLVNELDENEETIPWDEEKCLKELEKNKHIIYFPRRKKNEEL